MLAQKTQELHLVSYPQHVIKYTWGVRKGGTGAVAAVVLGTRGGAAGGAGLVTGAEGMKGAGPPPPNT